MLTLTQLVVLLINEPEKYLRGFFRSFFPCQDSLSADSKTLMLVCVSPVVQSAEESWCSLNFAARVRTVELGKVSYRIYLGLPADERNKSKLR